MGKRKIDVGVEVAIPYELDKNYQKRRIDRMDIEDEKVQISKVAGPTDWTLSDP